MAAEDDDCIHQEVCIMHGISSENVCIVCGHYLEEKVFTSTNNRSDEICPDCSGAGGQPATTAVRQTGPKCKRENYILNVALGICTWCGFKNPLKTSSERNEMGEK